MEDKNKKSIKEKLSEMFVLPKEIIMDLPKITMLGNKQISIENYKGIVEYDSEKMRINSNFGLIKIFGSNLEITNLTNEEIIITGAIKNIEF